MKKFEFRLRRVLDLRRQQAEIERAKLENLSGLLTRIEAEKATAASRIDAARAHVKHGPSSAGEDLLALSHYETHIAAYRLKLDAKKAHVNKLLVEQRAALSEAERKVKLLEKLEARSLTDWSAAFNKELEELAADAFTARIMADRRQSESLLEEVKEIPGF